MIDQGFLNLSLRCAVLLLGTAASSAVMADFSYRGNIALQEQLFFNDDEGHRWNQSLSGEVSLHKSFGDGSHSLTFTPFFRGDRQDRERSHADIRELLYTWADGDYELKAGIGQVFWGVAESRNVVDIINQRDGVEGLLSNTKLGQPMLNVSMLKDFGELSLFILPGFRDQNFPGENGRPALPATIGASQYEHADEEQHIDVALRYQHYLGAWDFGLSYFNGTQRDPQFSASFGPEGVILNPLYLQIQQLGLDLQATLESWLLKFELVRISGDQVENHSEMVAGVEYSFYGINDSNLDLGVVVEYLWDERDRDSSGIFQDDVLVGLRFDLNDEQSTTALLGTIHDLETGESTLTLEASRRVGNDYKLTIEAALWNNADNPDESQFMLADEDFLQFEFAYFF